MDKFNRKNAKDAKYQAGNIVFACSEFQVRWIPTNVIVNRRQTFLAFFAPCRFVLCGDEKPNLAGCRPMLITAIVFGMDSRVSAGKALVR